MQKTVCMPSFGEIMFLRTVYGTHENQKHEVVPLDARLNLPESDFSFLFQEWSQVKLSSENRSTDIFLFFINPLKKSYRLVVIDLFEIPWMDGMRMRIL